MRIVYVGAVPPLSGGISQHGGRLVAALREEGHEVVVESWRRQYPARLYPGDDQVRDDVDPLQGARYRLTWWNPAAWVAAGRRNRNADLLVFPWVMPAQAPAFRSVLQASGLPAVAIVHNSRPHEGFPAADRLTRLALRPVRGVVAHARQVVEELAGLGIRPARHRVVAHPPNIDIVPTPVPAGAPTRLLFLGYVRPYKGVDVAIRAVGHLRRRGLDVRLTVAGEAWKGADALRRLVAELGLTDVVDLALRYVPDDEVARLLADHQVVVLPYRSATQSGVVPLALAAGRPTVATRVGGLEDQVDDGVTGRLVAPDDPSAIADGIEDILSRIESYSRAAAAARATWRDVARAVAEVAGAEATS